MSASEAIYADPALAALYDAANGRGARARAIASMASAGSAPATRRPPPPRDAASSAVPHPRSSTEPAVPAARATAARRALARAPGDVEIVVEARHAG